MFKTMGELMKYTIDKKLVSRNDLFTTDEQIWKKIRREKDRDKKLALLIDRADNKYVYVAGQKDNSDLYAICKSRAVDPLFLENGSLRRVSETNKEYAKIMQENLKPKEHYIKFLGLRS